MNQETLPTIGWLIQHEYLAYERQSDAIVTSLFSSGIPVQVVSGHQDPIWKLPTVDVVMVLGGIRFVRDALRRNVHLETNLQPLFGTDLHAFKDYIWKIPREHQLNVSMQLKPIFQLQQEQYEQSVFVKPDHSLKIRDATVVHPSQWTEWFAECNRKSISPSTLFWICDTKHISAEFRVALDRNGIIDYSSYMLSGEPCEHNEPMNNYETTILNNITQSICKNWLFDDDVIMLDVARVPEGLSVIECNAVSSSGWYGLNHQKIIQSVHSALLSKFYTER